MLIQPLSDLLLRSMTVTDSRLLPGCYRNLLNIRNNGAD